MTDKEFCDLVDRVGVIPSESMEGYLKRIADAAEAQERARCLKAVADEEELPGPMPDENWIMSQRVNLETHLRSTVQCVKRNIKTRIEEK